MTFPADGLEPSGARTSAGTVITKFWALFQYKRVFWGIGIPIIKIRWLWDHIILIIGIPTMLVRWHLYNETAPWFCVYKNSTWKVEQLKTILTINTSQLSLLISLHFMVISWRVQHTRVSMNLWNYETDETNIWWLLHFCIINNKTYRGLFLSMMSYQWSRK